MRTKRLDSWNSFRATLSSYAQVSRSRRDALWFRGQGDSRQLLRCTLDRLRTFQDDFERADTNKSLQTEFRSQVISLGSEAKFLDNPDHIELVARHHGIPSTILDWTESPYVAAYFAFTSIPQGAEHVAIWLLDTDRMPDFSEDVLKLIWDIDSIKWNPRALRQRAVFMNVRTIREPLEKLLGQALWKFTVPVSERWVALDDLDEMMVNGTSLYYDLDGAAQTAAIRTLR